MSGARPFRVCYQTLEFGDVDIHVRALRDLQEFSDEDGAAAQLGIGSAQWSVFGVMWTSGEVLARFMFDYDVEGLRVLEVGCGIGLTSLVLSRRNANITATDRHPEVEAFLLRNVALNQGRAVPFVRTDWEDEDDELGRFDLIVGGDVLYEAEHVDLLGAFIERHAKPRCAVVIVDPGRRQHARFSKAMVKRGYSHAQHQAPTEDLVTGPFRGQILEYARS